MNDKKMSVKISYQIAKGIGDRMNRLGISGGLLTDIHLAQQSLSQPVLGNSLFRENFFGRGNNNDSFQENHNKQIRRGKKNAWPVPRIKGTGKS